MVKPWETATIGDFLDFKNGLNKGKEFFGYGTPIVNYTDVYKKRALKKSDVRGRVSLTREEIQRFDARKNDVFFTRTSETPEEVGISSVLLEDIDDCVFSGFVLRGRPKNDMFVPEYCKYCFTTEAVRSAIVTGCTYTTRALTNGKQLSAIEIEVPPKPEQKAIAQSLTEIDELISSLEKLITKKKAIKQGAMQELLTGKRRLPGFSGEWKEYHLSGICQLINGRAYSQDELLSSGKYRVLRLGNLFTNGHWYYSDLELPEKQYCAKGDLIYAWSATFGPHIWQGEKVIYHYHIWKVRLNALACMEYVYHYLSADVQTLMAELQGGTMAHLTKETMEKRMITIPEYDEQIAIAEILTTMDSEIEALEKKLTKYRQIKQGMMQQLLTGKIRLV